MRTRSWCARCSKRAPMVLWRRPRGCSSSRRASRPWPTAAPISGRRWPPCCAMSSPIPSASSSSDFLTDREREILQLVAESYSTKEIAVEARHQREDGGQPSHQPDAQAQPARRGQPHPLRPGNRPDRQIARRVRPRSGRTSGIARRGRHRNAGRGACAGQRVD